MKLGELKSIISMCERYGLNNNSDVYIDYSGQLPVSHTITKDFRFDININNKDLMLIVNPHY